MDSMRPSTAYFVAQYGPRPGTPRAPDVEEKMR